MSQAKIFEENFLGGETNNSLEREKIIIGNQGGTRVVGGETKRKLSINFYGVPTAGVRQPEI